MPGLIDTVYVRIRPMIAGFAEETTAGIRGALTDVDAQIAASTKSAVAGAAQEVDANKAVADSYLGVADAAQTQVRSMAEIETAAKDQMATVDAVAKANVAATVQEQEANVALATSYQGIAAAATKGSEEQIAASKLAAEAAVKAGIETKAASEEASTGIGGVKSHLLSLGNVLGVGFGAAIGVDLVKHVVGDAAQVQKSAEVIRQEFGGASKQVFVGFKDSVAANLGVSAQLADATSARFGILFHQLKIAPQAAATMTTGFERLAGSLSAIKGVDPTQVMQNIVLAAAGNTRGLKQLGIVVDSTSEKVALFGAQGLTMTGTLTPAQKAIAIYRIATENLGRDMELARKHSGDLANVQRRLSAEFSNAKDALGTALLPIFTKYTTELANWLGRMEQSGRLQRDFNEAAKVAKSVVSGVVAAVKEGVSIWDSFSNAVGGTTHAVEILLAVMAVAKLNKIAGAVAGIGGTFSSIGKAALSAGKLIAGMFTTVETESVATAGVMDSALVSTGIGAIVVAIGIAAAYVLTHWQLVKEYTLALAHATATAFKGMGEIIVGVYQYVYGKAFYYIVSLAKNALDLLAKAAGWLPFVGGKIQSAARAVDSFTGSVHHFAEDGRQRILTGWGDITNGVANAWTDSLKKANTPQAKDAAKKTGTDAGQQAANSFQSAVGGALGGANGLASTLTAPMKPVLDQVQNAITSAKQKIQSTIMEAKNNLTKIGDDLAKTIEQIQAKIGGAAGAIAGSPQGQAFAKLKKLIEEGAPAFEIQRAQAALGNQLKDVGKTQQPLIKTQLDNLTAAFNTGKITFREFEARLHKILHDDGLTMQQALKAGGSAFADTFKAQVAALKSQADQINQIPAKLRGIGGAGGAADIKIIRPLEVIRQENQKIAVAAVHQRDEQIRYAAQTLKYQQEQLKAQQKNNQLQQEANQYGVGKQEHRILGREATRQAALNAPVGQVNAQLAHDHGIAVAGAQSLAKIPPGLSDLKASQTHIAAGASSERRANLDQVVKLVNELGTVGHQIVEEEQQIVKPLDQLHQDNVRIAAEAAQQRTQQIRATDRVVTELRQLRRSTGRAPGFNKEPHGKGSHDARLASRIRA